MPRTTGPGRPALEQAQDNYESIVDSACLHFAQQGIKGSSNREIAAGAKVTAAMVHYYFKRKEQLHEAVLHKMFDPLIQAVSEVSTLQDWVHAFHAHLSTRPWLPHLMIREVLPHNGGLRALFLRAFAPTLFGSIRKAVAAEIQGAKPGKELDVDRHVVLLMGMLVYPFLALGLAQNLTGRTFDNTMFEGFRDDALALFRNGIGAY
jgi:TetR/AcrR family transcriptional regulator